mmetsp:Transcript_36628/g.44777  ORF Transcript_36628/g.44777 Transcript_36628/m.44777 type:complete len:209 (-) Transcript_36628:51-677(-)
MECSEGGVDLEWKLDKPMTGPEFRDRLSEQICEYCAADMLYPGDKELRLTNQSLTKRRGKRSLEAALESCSDGAFRVSYRLYLDAKRPQGGDSRLCSDNLTLLKRHMNSFNLQSSNGKCQICGNVTWFKCEKCGLHCCYKDGNSAASVTCSIDLHDDKFFGLTLDDRVTLVGEQKKFKRATKAEIKSNKTHIRKLNKKYLKAFEEEDD